MYISFHGTLSLSRREPSITTSKQITMTLLYDINDLICSSMSYTSALLCRPNEYYQLFQ